VSIKQQSRQPVEEEDDDDFGESKFWKWDSYADYLLFISFFSSIVGLLTLAFRLNPLYQGLLGFSSAGVEALLGTPQFMLNYRRQNTSGLS